MPSSGICHWPNVPLMLAKTRLSALCRHSSVEVWMFTYSFDIDNIDKARLPLDQHHWIGTYIN